MWRSFLHPQEVIFGNGEIWSEFRRNKLVRDLHDNFFQLATKRFISRPNFECCLLKASRGYVHSRASHDEELVSALDLVYDSFDALSKEILDWRRFLFYFHFTLDPRKSAKEQLLSAFSKIGNKSYVDLQELNLILFPLVKADSTTHILWSMDEAWAQVRAVQQGMYENFRSSKLTLTMFQQMLELEHVGLHIFFHQSKHAWGRGRIFPVYICQWEEDFYNKTLLQLVNTSR